MNLLLFQCFFFVHQALFLESHAFLNTKLTENMTADGCHWIVSKTRGVKPLILSLSMVLKKNTAESKGMKYGIPALDAVRKFSKLAWLFLAKPLDFLHLCMGGYIHKINTNLILLTGPGQKRNPIKLRGHPHMMSW
jgi:hypothetical protein